MVDKTTWALAACWLRWDAVSVLKLTSQILPTSKSALAVRSVVAWRIAARRSAGVGRLHLESTGVANPNRGSGDRLPAAMATASCQSAEFDSPRLSWHSIRTSFLLVVRFVSIRRSG